MQFPLQGVVIISIKISLHNPVHNDGGPVSLGYSPEHEDDKSPLTSQKREAAVNYKDFGCAVYENSSLCIFVRGHYRAIMDW